MEPSSRQSDQLSRLERAAQEADDPRVMEKEARRPKEKFSFQVHKPELLWLAGFAGTILLLFGLQTLMNWKGDVFEPGVQARIHNYLKGATLVFMMLTIAKAIEIFAISRIASRVARFNIKRIFRLVVAIAIILVTISVLFANWYTAVVSLGLISLVLGFALQMPISSFIAWIYILARAPYRVGDRIKIGEAHGDVIDVGYLDTTLWEFGGEHLWTDHPSGRVIKFPNAAVFDTPVFNYSWPLFPYVWNEIKFQLAYESDLEFVSQTMRDVVDEEIGHVMREKVKVYKGILAKTPVDELQVKEYPVVHFRVGENTWLEAIVRYLVHPKEAGRVKTRLITRMLEKLNAVPERVLFPKSNLR